MSGEATRLAAEAMMARFESIAGPAMKADKRYWQEMADAAIAAIANEESPAFYAMVNAMRDEYHRLKGFHPYTADLISMLKAAFSITNALPTDTKPLENKG